MSIGSLNQRSLNENKMSPLPYINTPRMNAGLRAKRTSSKNNVAQRQQFVNTGISDEKEFLRLMGQPSLAPLPLLRVTRGDLSEQPALVMLEWRKYGSGPV